jgi:hypothetical protein
MSANSFPGTRQCAGKRRYATKKDAKRAAVHATSTIGGGNRPLIAYRCENCGGFHIGHKAYEDTSGTHNIALRHRANEVETMIRLEQEALDTAQTPTQRRFYEKRIADMQVELLETLSELGAEVLQ